MNALRRQFRLERLSIEAQEQLEDGSPDKSAELCRKLIREWAQMQGPDGDNVMVWRRLLGRALVQAHRFNEAEEVLSQLLVDRERLLDPDDPTTLDSMGHPAHLHFIDAQFDRAVDYYDALLARTTEILGENHPDTLETGSTSLQAGPNPDDRRTSTKRCVPPRSPWMDAAGTRQR